MTTAQIILAVCAVITLGNGIATIRVVQHGRAIRRQIRDATARLEH
jgi:hypothetical protein